MFPNVLLQRWNCMNIPKGKQPLHKTGQLILHHTITTLRAVKYKNKQPHPNNIFTLNNWKHLQAAIARQATALITYKAHSGVIKR